MGHILGNQWGPLALRVSPKPRAWLLGRRVLLGVGGPEHPRVDNNHLEVKARWAEKTNQQTLVYSAPFVGIVKGKDALCGQMNLIKAPMLLGGETRPTLGKQRQDEIQSLLYPLAGWPHRT